MAFIDWTPELSVGIGQLDEQHKQLVAMVNDLHAGMREGKGKEQLASVFGRLTDYTSYHFATEEELFEKYGFPEREAHRKEHVALTKQATTLREQFQSGKTLLSVAVLEFLRDWVTNHIEGSDKKYTSFLQAAGMR